MIQIFIDMSAELDSMLRAIQPFAAWHINSLGKVMDRYFAILEIVNNMRHCGRGCTTLIINSGALADFMAVSKHSGSAHTYNRASFELSGDIRDLLCVLKNCA